MQGFCLCYDCCMHQPKYQTGQKIDYLYHDEKPHAGTISDSMISTFSGEYIYTIITTDGVYEHANESSIFRVEIDLAELLVI